MEMSSEGRYCFYPRRDDENFDSSQDKWKRKAFPFVTFHEM